MKSNYKPIGKYIRLVDERNAGLKIPTLLGLSISKEFIPSVANIIGSDMENYKIIRKNQFACSLMQVRRDKKIPVALLKEMAEAIISQAYPVFEVIDPEILLPEYLMMWFSRPEFDREACFYAVGGVRGGLEWEDLCNMQLPVSTIAKQKEIVKEYHTIVNRIKLNEQLNQKLEETAQAIYKQWFVDFEFPDENGNPYKSSGGEMIENEIGAIPKEWKPGKLSDLTRVIMGQSPKGDSYNTTGSGTPLVNGPVEFGQFFTKKSKWTTQPTKMSQKEDLIVCVRGSTTGRFVISDADYCLGRGVGALRAKISQTFVNETYKKLKNKMLTETTGSTFPNWGGDLISNFPVLTPNAEIVQAFENNYKSIRLYQEASAKIFDKLCDLRELLLSKMATGNI